MYLTGGGWPTTQPEEIFKIVIYGRLDGFHYEPGSEHRRHWDSLGKHAAFARGMFEGHALQFVRNMTRELIRLQKLVRRYATIRN